jgi:hypothetical protein
MLWRREQELLDIDARRGWYEYTPALCTGSEGKCTRNHRGCSVQGERQCVVAWPGLPCLNVGLWLAITLSSYAMHMCASRN